MSDIAELKRQGLSIQAISAMTGFDRKTVRKYLRDPAARPEYKARPAEPSKLDAFKPFLEERMKAGVWNAMVLLRELRERGYAGGYTILTDWLRPQRAQAQVAAVRRFETPPGRQAQVDWGHLGTLEIDGIPRKLWGFVFTLGLQPDDDGIGGAEPETRHIAADARRGLPATGRGAGRDPVRFCSRAQNRTFVAGRIMWPRPPKSCGMWRSGMISST